MGERKVPASTLRSLLNGLFLRKGGMMDEGKNTFTVAEIVVDEDGKLSLVLDDEILAGLQRALSETGSEWALRAFNEVDVD